jgi:hypothetical protein
MDERYYRGTFADSATDTLHRFRAHITHCVHARHARFERRRRPPVRDLHKRSGDNEGLRIERDATATKPICFGVGANEYK